MSSGGGCYSLADERSSLLDDDDVDGPDDDDDDDGDDHPIGMRGVMMVIIQLGCEGPHWGMSSASGCYSPSDERSSWLATMTCQKTCRHAI